MSHFKTTINNQEYGRRNNRRKKKRQQHTNRTAFFVRFFCFLELLLLLFCYNLWFFWFDRRKYSLIHAIKFSSTLSIPNFIWVQTSSMFNFWIVYNYLWWFCYQNKNEKGLLRMNDESLINVLSNIFKYVACSQMNQAQNLVVPMTFLGNFTSTMNLANCVWICMCDYYNYNNIDLKPLTFFCDIRQAQTWNRKFLLSIEQYQPNLAKTMLSKRLLCFAIHPFVLNLFHTIQCNEKRFFLWIQVHGTHKNQRSYSICTLSLIVFILCRSATHSKTLAYALLFIWFFF